MNTDAETTFDGFGLADTSFENFGLGADNLGDPDPDTDVDDDA